MKDLLEGLRESGEYPTREAQIQRLLHYICRSFYVLTEDRQRLASLWQLKDLDGLAGFREMEDWIKGQECLFRVSRRPVSEKEAEQLAELSGVLLGILS